MMKTVFYILVCFITALFVIPKTTVPAYSPPTAHVVKYEDTAEIAQLQQILQKQELKRDSLIHAIRVNAKR